MLAKKGQGKCIEKGTWYVAGPGQERPVWGKNSE